MARAEEDASPEDEPPRRKRRRDEDDAFQEDESPRGRKRRDEAENEGEDEPPDRADEEDEEPEEPRPQRKKKRRRRRSIRRSSEPSEGFTIQGGWLDGIFGGPNLVLILIAAFLFSELVFPFALFAAITAADSEALRNAILALVVCLVPGGGCCCLCGLGFRHPAD
jgi:hypothetical protein